MKRKSLIKWKRKNAGNKTPKPVQWESSSMDKVAEKDFSGFYSYGDYFRWKHEDRIELIRGKVFRMNPTQSLTHQRWCGLIYVKLYQYLEGKQAEVFIAPFDIRLPDRSDRDEDIFTVVQPDLCVVCDPGKLDEKGCLGTPDIVIEVLSEGNNWRELIDKYKVYEEVGVKEYWIINPKRKHFYIYTMDQYGRFRSAGANMYHEGVLSSIFPDFKLNLQEVLHRLAKNKISYER